MDTPNLVENLLRFFEPTLGFRLPTFGMSVKLKAFSIRVTRRYGQPFRRTLVQSHSAEQRFRVVMRLRDSCVLWIVLRAFAHSNSDPAHQREDAERGFKVTEAIVEDIKRLRGRSQKRYPLRFSSSLAFAAPD